MNLDFFGCWHVLRMTNRAFNKLLGGPPRKPQSKISQRQMDLARSIQVITEEVLLKMARYAHQLSGSPNLVMAGGVALNCVANGRVLREVPFENVWIQPAAGDAGGALGVALAIWHRYLDQPRVSAESLGQWRPQHRSDNGLAPYADAMKGSYLGPKDSEASIERYLNTNKLPYKSYPQEQLAKIVAEMLAQGKVIGLHQGRM